MARLVPMHAKGDTIVADTCKQALQQLNDEPAVRDTHLICVRACIVSMGAALTLPTAHTLIASLFAHLPTETDESCRRSCAAALGASLAQSHVRETPPAQTIIAELLAGECSRRIYIFIFQ
jgi:hypothetical protein